MTAADPQDAPTGPPDHPVLLHRLDKIDTTGRMEATLPTKNRAQQELVHSDHADQHPGREPHHGNVKLFFFHDSSPPKLEMNGRVNLPFFYGILVLLNPS